MWIFWGDPVVIHAFDYYTTTTCFKCLKTVNHSLKQLVQTVQSLEKPRLSHHYRLASWCYCRRGSCPSNGKQLASGQRTWSYTYFIPVNSGRYRNILHRCYWHQTVNSSQLTGGLCGLRQVVEQIHPAMLAQVLAAYPVNCPTATASVCFGASQRQLANVTCLYLCIHQKLVTG